VRRAITSAAILAAFVHILVVALPATANGCGLRADGTIIPCPRGDSEAGGISYHYDGERGVIYPRQRVPDGLEEGVDANGVKKVWQTHYVEACGTAPSGQVGCVPQPCQIDGRTGTLHMVYRRLADTDVWQYWAERGLVCAAAVGQPIVLADIRGELLRIIEERFKHVAEPVITVAPAVNALVNLPVIASTPNEGPLGFDITNPLPGRVEASPVYSWAWSNGTTNTGAGVGYDGTSPTNNPGHYPVQSTYASGGAESVGLQVTWSITLTVPGIAPITDIEPLVYEASEGFAVRSARSVLVE
jgi:hypothetical protein